MKLRCMALDPNAEQALQICLSGDKDRLKLNIESFDISSLAVGKDAVNLIISSHLDEETITLLKPLKEINAKNILIYPDNVESFKLINKIESINLIPAPIEIESLTTIGLSSTLDTFIDILLEPEDDDIIFGIENPADIFRENFFVSTYSQSANRIESAMLSMVRNIWEIQSAYSIAMAIHVYPDMSLITLDELLDLLESRIPPEAKLYIVYKNDLAQDEKPYISLLLSRYLPRDTSFQTLLDKEDGYLSKIALIIDWFNEGVINGYQADMLAKDNAIEPNDLKKIYDIVYEYPQNIAEVIKELREAPDESSKIDIIIKSIKDGIVDTLIIEELAKTHKLPIDLIIKKMEIESKE